MLYKILNFFKAPFRRGLYRTRSGSRNPVTSGYSGCRIKSGMTNSALFAKPTTFGSFTRAAPLAKKTASLIKKETQ
jgi:hypothetical protein